MTAQKEKELVHEWNRLRLELGATNAARRLKLSDNTLRTMAVKHGIELTVTRFRGKPASDEKVNEWIAKMRLWKKLGREGMSQVKRESVVGMTRGDYIRWSKIITDRGLKVKEARP